MKTQIFLGCASLAAVAALFPALAANPGGSGPAGKSPHVTLQAIPGSPTKRVILTAKAAERLGIETGKISEQPIVRKQMVGGLVIPRMEKQPESKPGGGGFGDFARPGPAAESKPLSGGSGGFARAAAQSGSMASSGFAGFTRAAPAPESQGASGASVGVERVTAAQAPQPAAVRTGSPAANEAWLLVTLSQREWEQVAKDQPARVLPLATRDKSVNELVARPSGMQPHEDSKRSMLKLYYVVQGKDHGLEFNKRMRVELPLAGSNETYKVVPYSAVYYDGKGAPWVYVSPQPLTYERQRITVDRIVGDVAVLSGGPPSGTAVVVTGAALLYGTEVFGK